VQPTFSPAPRLSTCTGIVNTSSSHEGHWWQEHARSETDCTGLTTILLLFTEFLFTRFHIYIITEMQVAVHLTLLINLNKEGRSHMSAPLHCPCVPWMEGSAVPWPRCLAAWSPPRMLQELDFFEFVEYFFVFFL
jgi:hypothetical protein